MDLSNPHDAAAQSTSGSKRLNAEKITLDTKSNLLERCFQAVNKKHFKNAITATTRWEVPTGTVNVRENPFEYHLSQEEECVFQKSVEFVKLDKLTDATTLLTPLAEAGHRESQLAMCHILRKTNGDWKRYAEMYNTGVRTVKAVPAACYYPDTKVIAIHPHLLNRNVPQFVLRYLIFHECCHQVIPSNETDPHPSAFMDLEAQAPHRERAVKWLEKEGFPTLRLTSC